MTLKLNTDGTVSETTEVRREAKAVRDELNQIKASIEQIDTEKVKFIEEIDTNRAKLVARKAELKALLDTII